MAPWNNRCPAACYVSATFTYGLTTYVPPLHPRLLPSFDSTVPGFGYSRTYTLGGHTFFEFADCYDNQTDGSWTVDWGVEDITGGFVYLVWTFDWNYNGFFWGDSPFPLEPPTQSFYTAPFTGWSFDTFVPVVYAQEP